MAAQFLFDAVIFDLDGTLVATERFWVAAATRGAERAFAELGLAREMPSAAQWLSMVGLPLDHGFANVFPELDAGQRSRVMELCVEEEHAALRAGGAAPMPGAFELLRELRAGGVKLGIASNCSMSYLRAMLDQLDLRSHVDSARCLDSAEIANKADMIASLLAEFGTRSAVMVGDRATDAAAAHANAIPHVHLASGLAPGGERVDAEAVIESLRDLPERLRGRDRTIERALTQLGVLEPRRWGLTIGITGRSAVGKTLFARDAAQWLERSGRAARVVSLDTFLRSPGERAEIAGSSDDHLGRAWDLARLARTILEPRAARRATDAGSWGSPIEPGETLLLEGLFLADPRVRTRLERWVQVEAGADVALARVRARDGETALARTRRDFWPAQQRFEELHPPAQADLCLELSNPLAG